jgi:Domain of unknown function (DUF4034)
MAQIPLWVNCAVIYQRTLITAIQYPVERPSIDGQSMFKWSFKCAWARRSTILLTPALVIISATPVPGFAVSADPGVAGTLVVAKETETLALCTRVENALSAHHFDVLDATELAMRDPNVRLVGGNSQLYHYYGALAAYSGSSLFSCSSELTFEQKRRLLEQWLATSPKSIAAHIALAQLWTNGGWAIRGDGYADAVTDQQWQSLATALANAKGVLGDIDGRNDPHMYYILAEIARGQPNSRPLLDRLYAAAVKAYPGYFHYYSQRANLLQERWYGQPGELKSYAASVLTSPGGDAGLVAYSYISFTLMRSNERLTLLKTTGLSWPIVKSAYAKRGELYGLRNRDWNALCNLALAAIDRDTAKSALAKIQGRWDPDVWVEEKYFREAVSWTMGAQR